MMRHEKMIFGGVTESKQAGVTIMVGGTPSRNEKHQGRSDAILRDLVFVQAGEVGKNLSVIGNYGD